MVDINCGECGRDDCEPDKCLPGYRLFLDPHDDPKKFCYKCKKRLVRSWTKKQSKEYREIALECPRHGVIGYIDEQFRRIKN